MEEETGGFRENLAKGVGSCGSWLILTNP